MYSSVNPLNPSTHVNILSHLFFPLRQPRDRLNLHLFRRLSSTKTPLEKIMKKLLTLFGLTAAMFVSNAQAQTLLEWNFFGFSSQATQISTTNAAGVASSILSRGSGAASSVGNNSFRTTGFQNNGIATTNTDYFQFSLNVTDPSFNISLSSISMRFDGTGSFSVSPGVTNAWAYSLDGGTTYNLMSTFQQVGAGSNSFNLSGVAALQNVTSTNQIFFRYYASGQTPTGGWGFSSSSAASANNGLVLNGVVPEPSTYALLALSAAGFGAHLIRRRRR